MVTVTLTFLPSVNSSCCHKATSLDYWQEWLQ